VTTNPNANDNVAATSLQGHSGPIRECATCHMAGSLPSTTLSGPHGMHVVNDSRFWNGGHGDLAQTENKKPGGGSCASCHGGDHLGTVLSRVPVDRTFGSHTVKAGQPVACNLCHSIGTSFGN